jgi:hypothetical protein
MAGETGTWWANAQLALLLNGTPIPGIADNAAASPLTQVYVALHTADPGAGGNMSTSEVTYTGYARAAMARTSAGWTIVGAAANPTSMVSLPACTGGNATAAYFSVGDAPTGAGHIFYTGPLTPAIAISNGVTPQLQTSSAITVS